MINVNPPNLSHSAAVNSRRLNSSSGVLLGISGVALIGIFDFLLGAEIATSIFYTLPIALSVWYGNRKIGIFISFLAAATWFKLDRLEGTLSLSHPFIPYWNALVRLGYFLLVTFLLDRVRFLTLNLDRLVEQRTAALILEVKKRKEMQQHLSEISQQEQERLAHELHDNVGAYLAGLAFRTKALAETLSRNASPQANEAASLTEMVNSASRQVRNLSRFLAPIESSGDNFGDSLTFLGHELENLFSVSCSITIDPHLPHLSPEQARHLYRIAQEAARNAVQHGKATSIAIELNRHDSELLLQIRNNGSPFGDPSAQRRSLGIRLMQYRAEAMGGTLEIITTPSENDTVSVVCRVPLLPLDPESTSQPVDLSHV